MLGKSELRKQEWPSDGRGGMGDEGGSAEQSALPPAFYRCPAAGGWGNRRPWRGYHVDVDRGETLRRGIVNVILRFDLPSSCLDQTQC